jgi:hypothetical protein
LCEEDAGPGSRVGKPGSCSGPIFYSPLFFKFLLLKQNTTEWVINKEKKFISQSFGGQKSNIRELYLMRVFMMHSSSHGEKQKCM